MSEDKFRPISVTKTRQWDRDGRWLTGDLWPTFSINGLIWEELQPADSPQQKLMTLLLGPGGQWSPLWKCCPICILISRFWMFNFSVCIGGPSPGCRNVVTYLCVQYHVQINTWYGYHLDNTTETIYSHRKYTLPTVRQIGNTF